MVQYSSYVLTVLGLFVHSVADAEEGAAARLPNILWLIGENLGPDLGCYGAALVQTPRLDQLAREGMRYETVIATCPICSPSRSAFMTGMSQIRIGAEHHRSHRHDHFHLPEGVRPVTRWLIDAGYFTANVRTIDGRTVGTGKTDLNFEVTRPPLRNTPDDQRRRAAAQVDAGRIWSTLQNIENEVRLFHSAQWADLPDHQPFFAQVNFPCVERSTNGWVGSAAQPAFGNQVHPAVINPDDVVVPPYYPDHPVTRQDWAGYLDAVCGLDTRVGDVLDRLAADGLADDTIVIFFGDNGRLEHRGLDWCYDSGDRVPMIIRWPKNFPAPPQYRAGQVSEQLISLLDVTATTLALAGLDKPAGMDGRIFLGPNADPPRRFAFSARDRADDAVQRIRAVRSRRYRYIRNLMPERPFMAPHRYKDVTYPVVALMHTLHREGRLTPPQAALMAPRLPDEEFYDLSQDPYEIHNLAESSNPTHREALKQHRAALDDWRTKVGDLHQQPEPPEIPAAWTQQAHKRFGPPDDDPR